MNTAMQIIQNGSQKGTPMQQAYFWYLPNVTNFYLNAITIEGKGQYKYTLNGKEVVVDLYENYDDSIFVPDADAGTALIVRGEKITNIGHSDSQHLTKINISGLIYLDSLDCSYNSLTELNISGLTLLNSLDCSNNSLTELNFSGVFTELTNLNCSNNSLTELNVSGLTTIRQLACNNNSLTELNVSGLINLTTLSCYNNSKIFSIKYNAIKENPSERIASLITNATSTAGVVYLNSSDTYYSTVANAATAKGWTIKAL